MNLECNGASLGGQWHGWGGEALSLASALQCNAVKVLWHGGIALHLQNLMLGPPSYATDLPGRLHCKAASASPLQLRHRFSPAWAGVTCVPSCSGAHIVPCLDCRWGGGEREKAACLPGTLRSRLVQGRARQPQRTAPSSKIRDPGWHWGSRGAMGGEPLRDPKYWDPEDAHPQG